MYHESDNTINIDIWMDEQLLTYASMHGLWSPIGPAFFVFFMEEMNEDLWLQVPILRLFANEIVFWSPKSTSLCRLASCACSTARYFPVHIGIIWTIVTLRCLETVNCSAFLSIKTYELLLLILWTFAVCTYTTICCALQPHNLRILWRVLRDKYLPEVLNVFFCSIWYSHHSFNHYLYIHICNLAIIVSPKIYLLPHVGV